MMDCDLELERGVDKGLLKRGTSRYISYPFRKCSLAHPSDHETFAK